VERRERPARLVPASGYSTGGAPNVSKWQVVDATAHDGPVMYHRGQIQFNDEHLPLADVSAVLCGPRCYLAAGLVEGLARFDVLLVHTDWRHAPVAVTAPWADHSRVAARQRSQVELSRPRQKNAWMRLVKAKISGQAHTLQLADQPQSAARLVTLATAVRSGDPENIEARAARTYWQRMAAGFTRRPRSDEILNQALDYGYAIIRIRMIHAIVAAGLSPTLGLWHRTRDNVFVLADDLLEPFRPAVDATVFTLDLPDDEDLAPATKHRLVATLAQQFGSGGETVSTAMDHLATSYGYYVEGDLDRLPTPVWAGTPDG
jgi:CRISP-associated protein Cas1